MTDTNVSEWLEAVGAANDGADGAEPAQAAEPEANVSTQPHAEAQENPTHPSPNPSGSFNMLVNFRISGTKPTL